MLRVGGQTGPEGGSRFGIGEMEEDQHDGAGRRQARPVAADERRKRDDGRELGEGREGQHPTHRPGHPGLRTDLRFGRSGVSVARNRIIAGRVRRAVDGSRPARRQGEKDQDHEQEDAERLEVAAPGRLDHEQRRPREQHEGPGNGATGPAGYLCQEQTGRQVGNRPQYLEREHRPARERARGEHQLCKGRIDGGDGRIVDARVPGRANRFEFGCIRGIQVGVDAGQLHVTVPEIAVDVVGQERNAGE